MTETLPIAPTDQRCADCGHVIKYHLAGGCCMEPALMGGEPCPCDLIDRLDREARDQRKRTTVVHIRKKAGPSLGNQHYSHSHRAQFIDGYVDPQSQTLCGAPATEFDMSWAETRHAKNLAYVTCETCTTTRRAS